MIALEAFGSLIWRHWRLVVPTLIVAALGIALLLAKADARHWQKQYDNEAALHQRDIANFKAASAQALAANVADVRAKETDAAAITEKANHDLESELADARRLAADYARRVRAASAAYPGGSGEGGLSPATSAPGGPFSAGMSVIPDDDLRICVENTVKVKGWQTFYASLRTRYNTDGAP